MIRHTKMQKFLSGPNEGESILTLPKAKKEYVGLSFETFAERAAYVLLETTYASQAVAVQRIMIGHDVGILLFFGSLDCFLRCGLTRSFFLPLQLEILGR